MNKGFSLMDVARETSIDVAHLSRFERGEADLGISKLQELSALLGCTIDELLAEQTNGPSAGLRTGAKPEAAA